MGAYGSLSRMVGFVYGSALTWAVGKSSSAPGQVPIEDLRAVLAPRGLTGAALVLYQPAAPTRTEPGT